jgi:hypothetical protein
MRLNQTINGIRTVSGLYPSALANSKPLRQLTARALGGLQRNPQRERAGNFTLAEIYRANGAWEEMALVVLCISSLAGILFALLGLM